MIKKFRILISLIAVLSAAGLFLGCGSGNKEGGAPAQTSTTIPPDGNITASIQSVTLAPNGSGQLFPVATFSLVDQNGKPLDPTTSGLSARFIIARLEDDGTGDFYYKNYIKSSSGLPNLDSVGTFATVGNGVYTYTFATNIKDPTKTLGGITFDSTKTHTVAAQIQRTIPSLADGKATFQQAANPYLTFTVDANGNSIPNTGPTREVVAVSNCNECHQLLNAHGGGRRDVALCILCHNPGVNDPVTTNSVDFKNLIHRIHMGESLPSNTEGGDFTIGTTSFAGVTFPFLSGDNAISGTPIECVKCHRKGTDLSGKAYGNDVDKWRQTPKIATCTTCHNLIPVDTTTNPGAPFFSNAATVTVLQGATPITVASAPHTGGTGAGFTDASCGGCHTGADEFSLSVPGAHTIIEKSSLFVNPATGMEDINFQIVSVTNATPGNKPTVTFKITDMNGNPYSSLTANSGSFNLKLGYMPVIDYQNNNMASYGQPLSQSVSAATNNGDGTWTITFASAIPATATGVGVVGIEGRKAYTAPKPSGNVTVDIGGMAQQYYFDLASGSQVADPAKQRRRVVDVEKCKKCHGRLSLHGANRVNNPQECVICHNPNATDKGQRPTDPTTTPDGLAERAIDFKNMIHSIHTGVNLTMKPYVIYGFGGSINDFSDPTYPGDRRNCLGCHFPGTYGLPLRTGILGTTISTGANPLIDSDNTRRPPMTSVCTACHDDHLSHAATFTDPTAGELCLNCHASGILQTSWDIAHRPVR